MGNTNTCCCRKKNDIDIDNIKNIDDSADVKLVKKSTNIQIMETRINNNILNKKRNSVLTEMSMLTFFIRKSTMVRKQDVPLNRLKSFAGQKMWVDDKNNFLTVISFDEKQKSSRDKNNEHSETSVRPLQLSRLDYEFLIKAFSSISCFNLFTEEDFELLIKNMVMHFISNKSVLFNEEDMYNFFFIIKSGKIGLFENNELVRSFSSGEYFGELSFLKIATYKSKRLESMEDSCIFVLNSSTYKEIHDSIIKRNEQFKNICIENIVYLKTFNEDTKKWIMDSISIIDIGPDEEVHESNIDRKSVV